MALQACKHVGGPFKAAVVPIVRFTLKLAFAERPEHPSVFIPLAIQRAGIVFSLILDAVVLRAFALRLGRALPYLSVVFASSPCRKVVLSRVQFLRSASGTRSARTHVPLLSVQHDPLQRHLAPQAPRCYRCPGSHEARRETKVRSSFRSHEGGPVGSSTCRVAKKNRQAGPRSPAQQSEAKSRASDTQSSSFRFGGRARNQYRRRLSSTYVSSSLEDPDGPAPGSVPLMSSSHTSPSGDRTHQ